MSGGDLTASTAAQLATLLAEGSVSARELLEAHLSVIHADGPPSFEGRPDAVNAWVRLYEEDAVAAADAADRRLRDGADVPPLCGIPVGLKDLYAVKGKLLTASSHAVVLKPDADSDVLGRASGRPARCWSGTSTRTSARRAARPTRSGTRARSTARRAARAAARPRRWRRA